MGRDARQPVLGGDANGIDGAHILTPMPYLMHTGKVTQNNQPLPMAIVARLNYDCQAISVAQEYAGTGVGLDASAQASLAAKKAEGKGGQGAMTFPGGTHDLWLRYWLAAGGIDPDKDVSTIVVRAPSQMVANMKGRQHGRVLCRRAVERATRASGHRLYRRDHRRIVEGPPGKALGLRADLPTGTPTR